MHYADFGPL